VASYFNDLTAKDGQNIESDSQANQRNQTEVCPATTTLKRKINKAASINKENKR